MKPILHKALFVIVLLFSVNQLFAEGEPIGARAASMGNASVSSTDIWSIFNNPAGMAKQSVFSAGVNYENRYLMKELGLKSAALLVPSRFGVLGLSFNQFGYSLYNENKIGLAYARSFGEIISPKPEDETILLSATACLYLCSRSSKSFILPSKLMFIK